jgi:hypothetical protein
MKTRGPRSAFEDARLTADMTPGQRYSALIVAALTIVVLTTGLPDGKVASGSGLGAVPDLGPRSQVSAGEQRADSQATTTTSVVVPVAAVEPPSPVADAGTTAGTSAGSEPAPAPDEPAPTTTTTAPPPTATPVPLPIAPPGL